MRYTVIVAILGLNLLCGRAEGRAWIVDANGGGDFDRVSSAYAAANDGDSILVRPGEYWEPDHDGPDDPPIRVHRMGTFLIGLGEDADEVVLRLSLDFFTPEGGTTTVKRVSFRQSASPLVVGGTALVSECSFVENRDSPDFLGGAVILTAGAVVEDCTFDGNITYQQEVGGGGLTLPYGGTVRRCVFRNNAGVGSAIGISTWDALIEECLFVHNDGFVGVLNIFGTNSVIRNCTFWANTGSAIWFEYLISPGLVVENCIFAETEDFAIDGTFRPDRVQCSDFWANGQGDDDLITEMGNILADPLLCDPANGDFGLAVGSPCVPGMHGGMFCDRMGAFGIACGASPVLETTWGRIKKRFEPNAP